MARDRTEKGKIDFTKLRQTSFLDADLPPRGIVNPAPHLPRDRSRGFSAKGLQTYPLAFREYGIRARRLKRWHHALPWITARLAFFGS